MNINGQDLSCWRIQVQPIDAVQYTRRAVHTGNFCNEIAATVHLHIFTLFHTGCCLHVIHDSMIIVNICMCSRILGGCMFHAKSFVLECEGRYRVPESFPRGFIRRCSRTAPPQGRVRPSSALSRGGPQTQLPKRPQSALERQPGPGQAGLDIVRRGTENPLPAKSAGAGTQFEKNWEMSVKRVHQNDVPGGRRIQVKANDSEVDSLLTASMDEEAQSADWKTSIRSAIAQGVITAQSRLLLQVEYCTATRPSSTLRGSKEQYSKVVTDLKEKVATFLWEYNAVVLDNRSHV